MIDPRIYHQPTNQRLYHQPRAYPPGSGLLGNELIDFDFIKDREGFETKGYVPDPEGSKSGVTIASGFDLGQKNLNDLIGLPDNIIAKLKPFLGVKEDNLQDVASKLGFKSVKDYAASLKITKDEADLINEFSKTTEINKLRTKWEQATGTPFNNLSKEQATVLTSVAFQFGNLETETPKFWRQTTSGDWEGAYKELLEFDGPGKDSRYQKRREKEAEYLEPYFKLIGGLLEKNKK